MTKEEKIELIKSRFWWHHIGLGDGIITPGHQGNDSTINQQFLQWIKLPTDLTGKTVLDIGCSDGFYAFECEKRGAIVTAIDDPRLNAHFENILIAKQILDSKITFIPVNIYDVEPGEFGKFDIVLAIGLLYHLKSFYIGLEIIRELTKDLLIIQSAIVENNDLVIKVCPPANIYDHITWYPSISVLELCLKKTGFTVSFINHYCIGGVAIHAV